MEHMTNQYTSITDGKKRKCIHYWIV